jgi:hypothetical protein
MFTPVVYMHISKHASDAVGAGIRWFRIITWHKLFLLFDKLETLRLIFIVSQRS